MLVWILAAVSAYFVKGLCGFANTLVFTSILSFAHNNILITPVDLLLGFPANVVMVWRGRKEIQWKVCLPMMALMLAGNIPGAIFLKNADSRWIKLIFGAVIVLLGAEMLLREMGKTKKMKENKAVLTLIGLASGILSGLYGVGALLGVYISRVTADTRDFKTNISLIFLSDNVFRFILYLCTGLITWESCRLFLILLPFAGLGMLLGMKSEKLLPEKIIRRLVILLLILSGLMLIVKAL